ncbi:hypothetical protein L596_020201 [Steinernema carpocapsae]|uniref:Uncharacterized protein n=1 Tax=Steinernema carpocapsae TaxID=34508 RepID=A0A4U5MTH4_STECR|nr:hypothetical protein L596_020201 [Steinernema carpocapsae]
MNGQSVRIFDRSLVLAVNYFLKTLSTTDPYTTLAYLQLYESKYVDLISVEKAYNASDDPKISENGSYICSFMKDSKR